MGVSDGAVVVGVGSGAPGCGGQYAYCYDYHDRLGNRDNDVVGVNDAANRNSILHSVAANRNSIVHNVVADRNHFLHINSVRDINSFQHLFNIAADRNRINDINLLANTQRV